MTRARYSAIPRRNTRFRDARLSDNIYHVERSASALPLRSMVNRIEMELADALSSANVVDGGAGPIVRNAHTSAGVLLEALVALASPIVLGFVENKSRCCCRLFRQMVVEEDVGVLERGDDIHLPSERVDDLPLFPLYSTTFRAKFPCSSDQAEKTVPKVPFPSLPVS